MKEELKYLSWNNHSLMWRVFTWHVEDPPSSLCSSYFEPVEQLNNWAIVKWMSYWQFWQKKTHKQTNKENQPKNILEGTTFLGIFQFKTSRKVLAQATKLWEINLLVKEVQQVNYSTVALTQTSVKSIEKINTSSVSSAT